MATEVPQVAVLQLKDVYDLAQSVGEQFQALIQQFGNTYLAELVNTVVRVLEHLEVLVEDNQKLQARICKLLLDNDTLLKENERLKAEAKKNDATLAAMKAEKAQLSGQVDVLQETNTELHKQLEEFSFQSTCHEEDREEGRGQEAHNGTGKQWGVGNADISRSNDLMEVPRMRRRLVQMENELKRTRSKLLNSQSTLKCIVSENNSLKAELEESKAEIGLKSLQLTHSGANNFSQESPKFYKKDLLVVLRERNELKEQLDALRDELCTTRLQLRYQVHSAENRDTDNATLSVSQRANTKVRDIVTSMTTESTRAVKKETRKSSKKPAR